MNSFDYLFNNSGNHRVTIRMFLFLISLFSLFYVLSDLEVLGANSLK